MQGMDCRNFKELLDSYLCGELAVETNHAILRHAEHCSPCRNEMACRRGLRQTLRHACSQDRMSLEAAERLRTCLRAEAKACERAGWNLRDLAARLFRVRVVLPAVGVAVLLLVAGSVWSLRFRDKHRYDLAGNLMAAAAGDHRVCGAKYISGPSDPVVDDSLRSQDPAYAGLEKVAAPGASQVGGLELRTAHVCTENGRRFAHLVYAKQSQVISLQVTTRDAEALGVGELPDDDGAAVGLQQVLQEDLTLNAFQTNRFIVLVIAALSSGEGQSLAERLGRPVAEYLRRYEAGQGRVSATGPIRRLDFAQFEDGNRTHKQ